MNKKDLQHRINQQASKIHDLELEVARLRNDKLALQTRITKYDTEREMIRKVMGFSATAVGGGGSGGFGTVLINGG